MEHDPGVFPIKNKKRCFFHLSSENPGFPVDFPFPPLISWENPLGNPLNRDPRGLVIFFSDSSVPHEVRRCRSALAMTATSRECREWDLYCHEISILSWLYVCNYCKCNSMIYMICIYIYLSLSIYIYILCMYVYIYIWDGIAFFGGSWTQHRSKFVAEP